MRELADGVHQLRGLPPNAINVYLVRDVLIDAATRRGERRVMRQIAEEARTNPEIVKTAPHTTVIGRLDQALAARKPNLRWMPGQEITH